jgi:hypothetical protein
LEFLAPLQEYNIIMPGLSREEIEELDFDVYDLQYQILGFAFERNRRRRETASIKTSRLILANKITATATQQIILA